jgi:dTDP-4-amino-4,6-dideoxygalactose transaminase
MDALCDIARRHNLAMIEDCAHAIETEYRRRKVGTFGEFGCLSFYVTKNVVTGEGGMVLGARRGPRCANQGLGVTRDEQGCVETLWR